MVWKRRSIKNVVAHFKIRPNDSYGSGKFGAIRERNGKKYIHQGLDIEVEKGEPIYAPFDIYFNRIAYPYPDKSFLGAQYNNDIFKMKIFYFEPILDRKFFKKGEVIGYGQKISDRYPNINDHIHLELRDKGTDKLLNPEKYV